MALPIYSTLILKDLSQKDLTLKESEELLKNIQSLNRDAKNIVYTLIREDEFRATGTFTKELPYAGIHRSSGPEFDLDNFPIRLKRILQEFVSIHQAVSQDNENTIRPNS